MIPWALLLYYLAFYALPLWDGGPGYAWVWAYAPGRLPGPQWAGFALAMAGGFALCCGASLAGWALLMRDDKRWGGVRGALGGTGWLAPLDLLLPFFLVGAGVYAVAKGLPLHGVAAAALPAALGAWLGAFKAEPQKKEEPKAEGEGAPEPPRLEAIPFDPLVEAARRHAGMSTPRDTSAHDVLFRPPALGVAGLADPDPVVVAWVVPRDEAEAALEDAPEAPFSGERPLPLVRAVEEGARSRAVAFLAERVAGPDGGSPEDRIARLRAFAAAHLDPVAPEGRARLPVSCLAERRATPEEATVLVAAMALSLALPVALWAADGRFGLAVEGLPAGSPVLQGREGFHGGRRYAMVGAPGPGTILPLRAPYRRPAGPS